MKNSYILLRNNKENGPFSLVELQQQGLKPGDLLWVEGQSVAWMQPNELPELRSLPIAGKAESQAENNEAVVTEQTGKKKSVYVSMPAGSATPAVVEEKAVMASNAGESVNTKYERPLDEIKDMYVKTLEDRKNRTARKKRLRKNLRYAAIFIGLPLLGALTGITLHKTFRKKPAELTTGASSGQAQPDIQDPVNATYPDHSSTPVDNLSDVETAPVSNMKGTEKETTTLAAEKNTVPVQTPAQVEIKHTVDDHAIDQPGAERTARDEKKSAPAIPVGEITPFVSVTNNQYKTGSFGGIRDLRLTVTNDSKYALENVAVELNYLKLGDELVKSETVMFRDIPANSTRTTDIPDNKRGVKISYRILKIEPQNISGRAGF